MTQNFYVYIFICTVVSTLRISRREREAIRDVLNDPETSRYLRLGIDKPEFRLSDGRNAVEDVIRKLGRSRNESAKIVTANSLNMFTPRPGEEYKLDLDPVTQRARSMKKIRKRSGIWSRDTFPGVDFRRDPVLNIIRSLNFRRADKSSSVSSSRELPNWKEEWREYLLTKQGEAINSTPPKGDNVGMLKARPWGVPCGDPAQHDMPWGTCVLPQECEPELRIFRGDFSCERTLYICCGLQLTVYDTYQGFDMTLEGKGLSTDSEEIRTSLKDDAYIKAGRKAQEKKKRLRDRNRRKRLIVTNIRKVVKEISRILRRYRDNTTKAKKRQTNRIKKFVKELKKRYKKDRQSIKLLHQETMMRIDADLLVKLNQIREMNSNFMKNSTFRDIVVNGTITKTGARMLLEAYPSLSDVLASFLKSRRSMGGRDYIDYDIDYGFPIAV